MLLLAIVTSLLVYCKQHLAVDRWGWAYSQDSEQEGREVKKAGDSEDSETDAKDLETGAEDSDTDAKDLETGARNSGTVKFGGPQNDKVMTKNTKIKTKTSTPSHFVP